MSLFLRRLALFLLPMVLVAIGTEVYVRGIPNSYGIKQHALEQMGDSVETIILGNSHAYSGIRPELLPGTVLNLANVSQTVDLDRALLLRCVKGCPRLRNVVMVADNSNLFDRSMEETDEWFRITYYTLYMHRLGGHNPFFSRYGLELLHFPSLQGKVKKWMQMRRPDCTPLGWDTDNGLEAKDLEHWNTSLVTDALRRHTCRDWELAAHNAAIVKEIAHLCRQHELRLTLVSTPVSPAYAAGIPDNQQTFIEQVLQDCHNRYGARILDASRMQGYADDEYFDPDHLTHQGAALFTEEVRAMVLR